MTLYQAQLLWPGLQIVAAGTLLYFFFFFLPHSAFFICIVQLNHILFLCLASFLSHEMAAEDIQPIFVSDQTR